MIATMAAGPSRSRKRSTNASLTSLAYQAIKEEIISTRLRPGEAVPTERLTSTLGLGRTPVREALLQLEREGFVQILPRIGTFISQLNLREIQQMYEVRRHLEGLAAQRAARYASAVRIAEVDEALGRYPIDAADPRSEADLAGMQEAGQRLHLMIVDTCQNDVLAQLIRSLHEHFRRFRSLSLALPQKIVTSHGQHVAILDAIKRHDGAAAERLVHEHFEFAAQSLLQSLANDDGRPGRVSVTIGDPRPRS